MKKEIAEKWVEALRSGRYKQTKKRLHKDDGYCCLGVLCELSGLSQWAEGERDGYGAMTYHYNTIDPVYGTQRKDESYPPPLVKEWAGLKMVNPIVPADFVKTEYDTTLGELNDSGEYNFDSIAAIIEKHWKTL